MNRTTQLALIVFTTIVVLLVGTTAKAQIPVPAPPQSESILIVNAYAHLGNGNVIEESAIGFENGKITLVTDAALLEDKSKWNKVIDASGKHVYPGFIAPNSTIGLTEIDAVRATQDYDDVGDIIPHTRSIIAYNTESRITPTVRSNGMLLAQATPRGGLISGTSSVVSLDAWNWEDAIVRLDDGVHVNWPRLFNRGGWWAEPGPVKKNKKATDRIQKLRDFFANAKAYNEQDTHEEVNLRYKAMQGIFDGSQRLYVHVDFVKEITQAVEFCREFGVKNVTLVGGYDSWMVADLLKENNISVMLRRVHDLPMRHEDDVDLPFRLPAMLEERGVLWCFNNAGDMEAMGARNMPFFAGTAVAYGLKTEQAVQGLTLNTAKILGIDKDYGSIEVGKSATLFISTGDALDMMTNNVENAFIDGRAIDTGNHQKDLYEKYRLKYVREGKIDQ